MSALPLIADMLRADINVCLVPLADLNGLGFYSRSLRVAVG